MKSIITLLLLTFTTLALGDVKSCALGKYKTYIHLQNEAFLFASKKLEKENLDAFKIIEGFPEYQIKYNDFKIYIGEFLLKNNPDMLNTDIALRKLVPSIKNKKLIAYLEKTSDPVYKKDGVKLQTETQRYLFGEGLGGWEGKEFEDFRKARGQLNEEMKVAPTMAKLIEQGSLVSSQICK